MTAVGREPGDSTMIRVSTEVKEMIEDEKIIPRESLNDCIKRGILENRAYRKYHPSLETRESLSRDITGVVTNPNHPESRTMNEEANTVWNVTHPEDPLRVGELIHHINGNHNDNRPENLAKATKSTHPGMHSEMRREFPDNVDKESNLQIVGKTI
jgi:hypothetical protein